MSLGRIFIITGPTCSGKTVISEAILRQRPGTVRAISVTTRLPRKNEVQGRDYFFVSREDFEKRIQQHAFLEYCLVYGEYYGTTMDSFRLVQRGFDVIKVIDVQGALKLKAFGLHATFFFFAPRTIDIVRARLNAERSDANHAQRLAMYPEEMQKSTRFDYIIDTSGDTAENQVEGCTRRVRRYMDKV